jgi:hypothetical protein
VGWVKLDDGFANHPKVVRLSLEARWAYVESLCYSAKYETDGVVPEAVAANGSIRDELTRAGLWENGPASVVVHDYLVYNPSRSQREQTRNRMRSVRAQNSDSREGDGSGSGVGLVSKDMDFEAFWAVYPRKVGKPKARAAFDSALRRASIEQIIAGAERYRDDPNRSDEFTAHPTTWLNRDGWDDDPQPPRRGRGPGSGPDRPGLALRRLAERNR